MNEESMEQTVDIILKKFFNKRYVVERPRPYGLEVIQARFVTLDELKELVAFAWKEGEKERKKKHKITKRKL